MAEGSIAADELRLLIERIERLEEEKKAISEDVRDVYAEAKARGYDVKTMRECVKLRKMEANAREERDALLETYRAALGMDGDYVRPAPRVSKTPTPIEEALERQRAEIHRELGAGPADSETTISVNGGPAVPLDTVKKALDIMEGRKERRPIPTGRPAAQSGRAA